MKKKIFDHLSSMYKNPTRRKLTCV